VADCPWQPDHRLVRFGLKGREIDRDERPASNLVFLIDVSGSMESPNKLPLVQQGLRLLVEQLRPSDHVAIVVYAGQSGLVLPSTAGSDKDRILAAIEGLRAGGSTNGAQGIEAAYEVASQNFIKGGTNRVLLATDGDFNVGVTSQDALVRLIEDKAKTGVFLTALGFGYDNLKDSTLEKLADKGNGQYAYVDDLREARKIFVDQLSGTLVTIAKDVKIQIEFNPAEVASYRLIGYENRILAKEDFNNDKKDAGDIGAGHTVTALYEIVPVAKQGEPAQGAAGDQGPAVDPLKYQKKLSPTDAASSGELLTLKLRYKQPDGDTSRLIETPVRDAGKRYGQASVDFRFAAGVAAFGMVLRNSPYKGNSTMDAVLELVREGRGSDQDGYRVELISLVERAKSLGAR
jgi:Ca-activated chloride channel family protein